MNKSKRFISNIDDGQKILSLFNNAYQDYIASRQLLLNDLLAQGCILANTSIEKYFKAIKLVLGEPIPRHHDITVKKFTNTFKNKFPALYRKIDFEFIELIYKSYSLRYLDELETNFSIVIAKRKTLAELDYIVNLIEESFKIGVKEKSNLNKYHSDKIEKNKLLHNENYLLTKEDKTTFLKKKEFILEIRKLSNGDLLETSYSSVDPDINKRFLIEGLKTKDEKRFQLSRVSKS